MVLFKPMAGAGMTMDFDMPPANSWNAKQCSRLARIERTLASPPGKGKRTRNLSDRFGLHDRDRQ
jgi:hypothetical protein